MKHAPIPVSAEPSKFLSKCLAELPVEHGECAVDVGCGFGRHTALLASLGYSTIALDYDPTALTSMAQIAGFPQRLLAVRCDLERGIPIRPRSADLVVAIEYPDLRLLGDIAALVAPSGHFVMETFTARGRNWPELPVLGSVRRFLEDEFRVILLREKPAGPASESRCTVKVFAQRR